MFSQVLLLFLLGLSCLQTFTQAETANGASECCFETHKKPFPAANIISYSDTRFDCAVPGVILKTKRGFRFCADPEEAWVKEIINNKPNISA